MSEIYSPIRVVQVLGALNIGGAETMVMNLYREIDREKVQFDFIIHTTEHCDFTDEVLRLGGRIYHCPRYTGKNHIQYCKWWKEFFRDHSEYQIIHGHVRSTAAIYLAIAKKYHRITIAHSHSTSNGKGVSAIVKNCMQLPIRYIADYMFACSEYAGEWLFGSDVVRKDNFKIIANGIDLGRFAFNEKVRKDMRKQLGVSDNTIVLGHVGRFTEPKNHRFLIEVFTEFQKKISDSKLLLVGDGELMSEIKDMVSSKKISESVIFVGNKSNTEDYYQVMDVFVFPSFWEGLGIVAIEAIANGLTVIASEHVPKEIALSENVYFLPLNDKNVWVKQIEKNCLRVKAEKSEKLEHYDIKQIAKEIQEFYLNLRCIQKV